MTEELKQNSAIFSKTWYEDNTKSYAANHEITFNQTCDVAIIGGGLAGLCLLQNLIKEGVDALLLEANEIGKNASGRNGGFCTPGWALSPEGIESLVGLKLANELNQFSKDGYNWMVNRICSENYRSIDTKKGVLSVSCSGSPVNEYPESLRLIQKDELRTLLKSDRYNFGVFSEEGYQFNPLNFLNCLQKEIVELGGRIFTNSKVVSMDYLKDLSILKVNNSNFLVSAKRIVFATGGYGGCETGAVSKSILPIQTYIAVTSPLTMEQKKIINCNWAIYDTRRAGNYYRILPDNRLLWGHSITALGTKNTDKIKKNALKDIASIFPELLEETAPGKNLKIDYAWSGNMAYASHMMPYVGQVKPNVYSLVGFGGHGMNTAPAAANILGDWLTGSSDKLKIFEKIPYAWNWGMIGPLGAETKYLYLKLMDRFSELIS